MSGIYTDSLKSFNTRFIFNKFSNSFNSGFVANWSWLKQAMGNQCSKILWELQLAFEQAVKKLRKVAELTTHIIRGCSIMKNFFMRTVNNRSPENKQKSESKAPISFKLVATNQKINIRSSGYCRHTQSIPHADAQYVAFSS